MRKRSKGFTISPSCTAVREVKSLHFAAVRYCLSTVTRTVKMYFSLCKKWNSRACMSGAWH